MALVDFFIDMINPEWPFIVGLFSPSIFFDWRVMLGAFSGLTTVTATLISVAIILIFFILAALSILRKWWALIAFTVLYIVDCAIGLFIVQFDLWSQYMTSLLFAAITLLFLVFIYISRIRLARAMPAQHKENARF
jgi:heme A synthase